MPLLPLLSVVFVGVVGGDKHDRIDQQVHLLLGELDVKTMPIRASAVRKLSRHAPGSREAIASLHVDGLVGGELVGDRRHRVLRMVVYDGDGRLDSLFEIPFSGHLLSRDELATLTSSVEDVAAIVRRAKARDAQAARKAKRARVVAAARREHRAPPPVEQPEIEMDPEPTGPEPEPSAAAGDIDTDAVTADELMAATSGVDDVAPRAQTEGLRMTTAVGLGVGGRTFSPGTAAMPGYASTAVGMVHLDVGVQPTKRTRVAMVAERSLAMTTPLAEGAVPTQFARWDATLGYALKRGRLEVDLDGGIGRRSFSIDSTDPAKSPDNSYNYLIAGLTARARLGAKVALRGGLAFEPVVSGEEPMESSFGEARRWAFDVGAALEVRPKSHVVVRAAANYQRFTWSWAMTDARQGGAVDHYPSATLSVGAEY